MKKRIDRYVEEALIDFEDWYAVSSWLGKERDCVNMFAMNFLARNIGPESAIKDLAQIRIECPVPQPSGYPRDGASKDLVIWADPLQTTWDSDWKPAQAPKVILEWKTVRTGACPESFHDHDMEWLTRFTREYPDATGYLVSVYHPMDGRRVDWAKVSNGSVSVKNRKS